MSTKETNPMISISVRVWTKLGYLYQTDNRRFLSLAPCVLHSFLQISYLIFSGKGLENVTLNAFFTVILLNSLFRVFFTMSHREKFEKFCESFMVLYNGIMDSGDIQAIEILKLLSFRLAIFCKVNLVLGLLASVLFVGYPLLVGSRDLPFGFYLLDVDFTTSPAYELGYLLAIVVTYIAVSLYIPFINTIMSFIVFGIVMIQNLFLKFQSIAKLTGERGREDLEVSDIDNVLVEKRLKLYIEYHKRIIRYVEELNELVATVCLVEIILFGILLSALLFLTIVAETKAQLILSCIYIFMIMYQLFNFYWLSNELIVQSEQLGFALYDSAWYMLNTKNQKTILLIIGRTQSPMNIMIGNIAPATLQTFQSILNVSYSYFTILRRNFTK